MAPAPESHHPAGMKKTTGQVVAPALSASSIALLKSAASASICFPISLFARFVASSIFDSPSDDHGGAVRLEFLPKILEVAAR